MPINRLTAYKVWISDLINSPYIEMQGEFESNYIEVKDKQISRANIIATIVNKFESEDKNYVSLTLDDNSEEIRVKACREDTKLINNFNSGDLIFIVARVRKYNDELYLLPEIVKQINPNWEVARRLELIKIYGVPHEHIISKYLKVEQEKTVVEEMTISNNLRSEILNLIEKHEDDGITLRQLKENLHSDITKINNVLEELIKEGQVYAINNKFRLLL